MAEYNLEERTFQFAKTVSLFIKTLPKSISNVEYSRQVIRSSSSVGANYIEANEYWVRKILQCIFAFQEKRLRRVYFG